MKRKISELTAEEFKRTFPIALKEYHSDYKDLYESEKELILGVANPNDIARINHIGSTAVKGLIAKPTIDILLELDGICCIDKLVEDLKIIEYGVEIFSRRDNPMQLLLGKGYSSDGYAERVIHLHVRYLGNWDELYFRDYLLAHPDVANQYGKLKQNILKDIEKGIIERLPNGNPNGYSQAKLDFVNTYSRIAKEEFPNRYKPCYR